MAFKIRRHTLNRELLGLQSGLTLDLFTLSVVSPGGETCLLPGRPGVCCSRQWWHQGEYRRLRGATGAGAGRAGRAVLL